MPGLSSIRRVRVAPTTDNTYANLILDPGAGYIYPKAESIEGDWQIDQKARPFQVADTAKFPAAAAERKASLKLVTEAIGFGGSPAGAGSGVAATDGENGLLLKAAWGNQTKDTGSAITSMTTTTITMTATTGFSVGGFVGITGADGLFYVRQVRSKTATVLTLDRAYPAAAGVAATVAYASNWFSKADSGHQHLFVDVETQDYRRLYYGGLVDFAIAQSQVNGALRFEWSFPGFADWADTAIGQPSPQANWPANLPKQGMVGISARINIGATPKVIIATTFKFALGNEIVPVESLQAKNAVQSWRVKDSKRDFSFDVDYADYGATLLTAFQNKTLQDVLVEVTQGGAGNSLAIAIPQLELRGMKRKSVGGLDYVEVSCAITRNDTIPSTSAPVPDVTLGLL